jgi:hypothetical protein
MMLKTTPRRSPLLKALYRASAVLKSLARAAKSFFEIIRKRNASLWPAWLQMALRSPLASFAGRLQRDEKAVAEALRADHPWLPETLLLLFSLAYRWAETAAKAVRESDRRDHRFEAQGFSVYRSGR